MQPFEDNKAKVAGGYLSLKEAHPNFLVREVSRVSGCRRNFAKNALRRLGMVIWSIWGWILKTTIAETRFFYFYRGWLISAVNSMWSLWNYCICLMVNQGVFVFLFMICYSFNHTFSCKANLGKLNQVPIDKFTPENFLWTIKHWNFIAGSIFFALSLEIKSPWREKTFQLKGSSGSGAANIKMATRN